MILFQGRTIEDKMTILNAQIDLKRLHQLMSFQIFFCQQTRLLGLDLRISTSQSKSAKNKFGCDLTRVNQINF